MSEGKSINLLKAAKELNIGIGTAVDFLVKKGFDVESKPNTKLSADQYGVLLKEFQGDKIVKDEAKQIVIGKIRREESPAGGQAPAEPTEQRDEPAEVKEILIKNTAAAAQADKVEEKKAEEQHSALKVVGKIDLDSLKRGAKPAPKEEPKVEPQETPKVAEKKEVVEPVKKVEEPVAKPVEQPKIEEKKEPIKEVAPKEEAPIKEVKQQPVVEKKPEPVKQQPAQQPAKEEPQDEVIRARSETLSGPKVVGKITLPVSKPHKPVASSSANAGNNNDNKRKRKRTNNGNGPVGQHDGDRNQHQGQGQGHGHGQGQGQGQVNIRTDRMATVHPDQGTTVKVGTARDNMVIIHMEIEEETTVTTTVENRRLRKRNHQKRKSKIKSRQLLHA